MLKQTDAVKEICPPRPSVAADGEMDTPGEQGGCVTVIEAEADFVVSAALVVTSVTGFAGGNEAGAVYVAVFAPVVDTVPQFVVLHPEPLTAHVTD